MDYFQLPYGVRVSNDQPIDGDRYLSGSTAERSLLIASDRAYDGLQVFDSQYKKLYILTDITTSTWDEITFGSSFSNTVTGLTYTQSTGVLSTTVGYSIPTDALQLQWNSAYTHSQSAHQTIINGIGLVRANGTTLTYDNNTYLTSQISHADVLVDGDFASQGIMLRGATSGTYSILTDNSANWNSAYTHSQSAHQTIINGIGLVRANGTILTYDNSTYYNSSNLNLSTVDFTAKDLTVVTAKIGSLSGILVSSGGTISAYSGITNYFSKYSSTGTLTNSQLFEVNGRLGFGVTNPATNLHIYNTNSPIDSATIRLQECVSDHYVDITTEENSGDFIVSNDLSTILKLSRNGAVTIASITGYLKGISGVISGITSIPQSDIAGLSTTLSGKESVISTGTTLQYWRGDKTFQTLNTSVVPELTNLYYTNDRAIASTLSGYTATSGTITSADSILTSIQKLGYDKHVHTNLSTLEAVGNNTIYTSANLGLATATSNGLLKMLPNDSNQYMNGQGNWSTIDIGLPTFVVTSWETFLSAVASCNAKGGGRIIISGVIAVPGTAYTPINLSGIFVEGGAINVSANTLYLASIINFRSTTFTTTSNNAMIQNTAGIMYFDGCVFSGLFSTTMYDTNAYHVFFNSTAQESCAMYFINCRVGHLVYNEYIGLKVKMNAVRDYYLSVKNLGTPLKGTIDAPVQTQRVMLYGNQATKYTTISVDTTVQLFTPFTDSGVGSSGRLSISEDFVKPETFKPMAGGASISWDIITGFNKTITQSSDFTLTLTNVKNGMSGDLRLSVTSPLSITSITASGFTLTGNGSISSLAVGVYHLCWVCTSSTTIEWDIAKYV